MARLTVTDLLNQIANDIQENTAGDITATVLKDLLDILTNNLYLPTSPDIPVENTEVPLGTAKTLNFENLQVALVDDKITITGPTIDAGVQLTNVVSVNQLTDLPAAVSGVITLAAGTTYLLGNDINLGTDRLVFEDRAVIVGSESLNTSLTYTGTGDMLTMTDATNRVGNMSISCPNGALLNWSDTVGGNQLRFVDVQLDADTMGSFSGTDSIIRFTNVSPSVTTTGFTFSGTFLSFLWDTSGLVLSAGTMFDLATAVFDSFFATKTLSDLASGATFLDGLPDSGNIATGGTGAVINCRFTGAGSPLSANITTDDPLWEFHHNDDIADTRPDALLYLQDNTVAETITTTGVPVKVIGDNAWVDERSSQSTNDNTGRSTYDGGKPVVVPFTMRASVEPVSGSNKLVGLYLALNGTPVAGSEATVRVDSGDPKSVTVLWQGEAQPGDYAEMFVSNETDTTDILVSYAIIRIN